MHPKPPVAVAAAIDAAPSDCRAGLQQLRALILDTAAHMPEVGEITECLKWGQPAFTTPQTKSGSTIRIGCPKKGGFALFAHCQTNIISSFVAAFPGMDRVDGNRAILFDNASQIDPARHGQLIAHALRYHL